MAAGLRPSGHPRLAMPVVGRLRVSACRGADALRNLDELQEQAQAFHGFGELVVSDGFCDIDVAAQFVAAFDLARIISSGEHDTGSRTVSRFARTAVSTSTPSTSGMLMSRIKSSEPITSLPAKLPCRFTKSRASWPSTTRVMRLVTPARSRFRWTR